jgi:hypothetical protein
MIRLARILLGLIRIEQRSPSSQDSDRPEKAVLSCYALLKRPFSKADKQSFSREEGFHTLRFQQPFAERCSRLENLSGPHSRTMSAT